MTFHMPITAREVGEALRVNLRHEVPCKAKVSGLFILAIILAYVWSEWLAFKWVALLFLLVVWAVISLPPFFVRYKARTALQRMARLHKLEWFVDEEGVGYRSLEVDHIVRWRAINRAIETPGFMFLMFNDQLIFVIYKSGLSEEIITAIRSHSLAAGVDISQHAR